jgi:predicted 3-demethylubiquinone-9 3-methyltransferase (glyoxalase superfamily)
VFPNSGIKQVSYYGDANPDQAGTVLTVDFVLDGQEYTGINGGPLFHFTEAVSLAITCADQAEVDYYWEHLTADGGEESMCGWLKDKYGLSWQVVPAEFIELMTDPDPKRVERATRAMYEMRKLDIATLRAAADGPS